jgi:hypothetical protein
MLFGKNRKDYQIVVRADRTEFVRDNKIVSEDINDVVAAFTKPIEIRPEETALGVLFACSLALWVHLITSTAFVMFGFIMAIISLAIMFWAFKPMKHEVFVIKDNGMRFMIYSTTNRSLADDVARDIQHHIYRDINLDT